MRILTATDQSLTLTTSAAGSIDYIVDWVDHSTTSGTPGSTQGNITTATTTTVCPAPASGVYRQITSINVSNRHATDPNIIKAFKTVGASSYAITDALTLAAGESISCSQSGICYMSADPDLNISAHAAQTSGIHGLNGTTGKTLSWNRTMTLSGATDGVTYTLPSATDTIMGQSGSYTPTGTWNWTSATVRWPSFDHLTMPNVKGYLTNTPPGTPTNGDTYIIGSAPTGAWAGSAGKVAAWSSVASAWEIYTPENGWMFQSNSARESYRYTSGAWEIYHQEGTWTATLTGFTGVSSQSCKYTKNGRNYSIYVYIAGTNIDITSSASVSLPITASQESVAPVATYSNITFITPKPTATVGTTVVYLQAVPSSEQTANIKFSTVIF